MHSLEDPDLDDDNVRSCFSLRKDCSSGMDSVGYQELPFHLNYLCSNVLL